MRANDAANSSTLAAVHVAVAATCAVWSLETCTRLSGHACGLHVRGVENIESRRGATNAVAYAHRTSTRPLRLISVPAGYASRRWMKTAMKMLPRRAPSVNGME